MRGLEQHRERAQRLAHEFGELDWKGFLNSITVVDYLEWCWYLDRSGPRVDDYRWSQLLAYSSVHTTTPCRAKDFSLYPEPKKTQPINPETFWGITGVEVKHGPES